MHTIVDVITMGHVAPYQMFTGNHDGVLDLNSGFPNFNQNFIYILRIDNHINVHIYG